MARSPEALVEASLLAWARETAGVSLTDAGRKLNSKKAEEFGERIRAWEAGDGKPSVSQLRKLAKAYKRPLAVFYLDEPPTDFQPVRDYRRVANHTGEGEVSVELRAELRRVIDMQQIAVTLIEEAGGEVAVEFPVTATCGSNPDTIAGRLRETLAVSTEDQVRWRDSYVALRHWRAAVEGLGALVTRTSGVSVTEMRGFSLADPRVPLICLNNSDRVNGQIFTLMHELTHVALHEGGICEWQHSGHASPENGRVETFCNHVAGAILVPAEDLLAVPVVAETVGRRDWDEADILTLARRFCVSREVIVRRLLISGKTTQRFYKAKRQGYAAEPAAPAGFGRVDYERKVANRWGNGFIELVLKSYYERRLSLADTSSVLGVRVRHLPAIEHEVMGWSHIRTAER